MTSKLPVLKDDVSGFILEHYKEGIDFAISHNGHRIELGQMTTSNGRCGISAGRRGIVVRIHRPFTHNFTTDIIEIHFEGRHNSDFMKFKALNL